MSALTLAFCLLKRQLDKKSWFKHESWKKKKHGSYLNKEKKL